MSLLCIECDKNAEYIFWGQSLCAEHYKEHKDETDKDENAEHIFWGQLNNLK